MEADELVRLLDNAFEEFAHSKQILVWVSGVCRDTSAAEPNDKVRAFVEAELEKRRTDNTIIDYRWPEPGVTSTCLTLDPEDGVCYSN